MNSAVIMYVFAVFWVTFIVSWPLCGIAAYFLACHNEKLPAFPLRAPMQRRLLRMAILCGDGALAYELGNWWRRRGKRKAV